MDDDPPAFARIKRAAAGLAPLVRDGLLEYGEAHNSVEGSAYTAPDACDLTEDQQQRLAAYGVKCLGDFLMQDALLAAWDIRARIGPMLSARKPRADVLVTAFRAADGRLDAATVEEVVRSEVAAFLARVRAK